MGTTELLTILSFVLAVCVVAYAAFWLRHLGLGPPIQKVATVIVVVIALAVLAVLAFRFAGGVIPR